MCDQPQSRTETSTWAAAHERLRATFGRRADPANDGDLAELVRLLDEVVSEYMRLAARAAPGDPTHPN